METIPKFVYLKDGIIYTDINEFIVCKTQISALVDKEYLFKEISADFKFRKSTAEVIDRYILHTIEEIYETYHEGLNFSCMPICKENNILAYANLDHFNDELIDIIAYLSSLRTLLNKTVVKKLLVVEKLPFEYQGDNLPFEELRAELFQTIISLIDLRIIFPERKWQYHRNFEVSLSDMIKRFDNVYEILNNAVVSLIILFIKANYTNFDKNIEKVLDDFNYRFYNKNKIVVDRILNEK